MCVTMNELSPFQVSCVDVGNTAVRGCVRRRENAFRTRLIREKPIDEVVDGAQGRFAHRGDRIAQDVLLHWSMIPELRARGAAGQRAAVRNSATSADERCGISICGKWPTFG